MAGKRSIRGSPERKGGKRRGPGFRRLKTIRPGRDARRELENVESVFRALAHPARRHVIVVLHFRGGAMSSREIASRFACSWPTTTRHLRVLEEAGIVRVTGRGRERLYRLDPVRLEIAREWLGWLDEPPLVGPSGEVQALEGPGRTEPGGS